MKMKKYLSILLALLLVATIFAGCGSSTKDSKDSSNQPGQSQTEQTGESTEEAKKDIPKNLKMATYYNMGDKNDARAVALEEIVQDFTQKTGIKVEYESIPWDQIESKLVITNQAGNPVDISWASSQKLASVMNAGALLPLDDYVKETYTQEELDDFLPVEKMATTYALDGKKYMFLATVHGRLLWYNKDLVPEPPKNLEEMIEIGKKITNKEKGIYGLGFNGTKHYGTPEVSIAPYLWELGGKMANSDGSAAWNSPEVAQAVRIFGDFVHKHGISPESVFTGSFDDTREAFKNGKLGMLLDGTYFLPRLKGNKLLEEGKVGVTYIPGINGPAPHFVNGWALCIPSKSKNPDGAWEFIKFFESTENQIKYSKVEGGAPVRKSAWKDPAFSSEMFALFLDNLEKHGRPTDPFVYYQEGLESLITAAMGYFLDPNADVEKLLDESAKAFNEKYGYSK
ncbi:MAG TPA: sugar ABC transporter substrate-binding protein [Clostridiaceae bacterium]|nr:sugar ABC transporter substrate-binding protein [Clostridiaceae bacterium]